MLFTFASSKRIIEIGKFRFITPNTILIYYWLCIM